MARNPPRGAAAQLFLLFLVAVLVGRLLLEPTGAGLVLLAVLSPIVLFALVALHGWRVALVLYGGFLVLALVARWFFVTMEAPWIVLLLVPALALSLFVLVSVLRHLWRDRRKGGRGRGT